MYRDILDTGREKTEQLFEASRQWRMDNAIRCSAQPAQDEQQPQAMSGNPADAANGQGPVHYAMDAEDSDHEVVQMDADDSE